MKTIVPSVKGTRDFYPEQMRVRSWLYQTMRKVSELFGYQEYEAPFLEYISLYAAKSGEELVNQQSFVFQDRGGEWITLRPELTPSLARMVAQKQNELNFPLRWWSFGPMWRYERPQKGRSREFFQWNIDLIGLATPETDAELAAVGGAFFREMGLSPSEVQIRVNNRRLLDSQLDLLKVAQEGRANVLKLIDRKEKMPLATWEKLAAEEYLLTPAQIDGIQVMLAETNLYRQSEELCRFFDALDASGVREYVQYSPEIVRGLDYYTGTVFEARDRDGEFRAILGGGRYDNLVGDIGGNPLPGVGYAMGDMVISLVLEKYNKIPPVEQLTTLPVLVTVFDDTFQKDSLQLAAELRSAGIPAISFTEPAKLNKQLKYADRLGTPVVLIVGPDENAQGVVTVKHLSARQQVTVPRSGIAAEIKKLLDTPPTS